MAAALAPCPQCHALNRVDLDRLDSDRADEKEPVCGRCRTPLPVEDGVTAIQGATLDSVVRSAKVPVVVDFWAPWCGPCRAFAPVFRQTARKHAGSAVFLKLDTEQDPNAARSHRIQAIPTLVGFRNGREAERRSGALPAPALEEFLRGLST